MLTGLFRRPSPARPGAAGIDQTRRLDFVDSLRGIAVLMVFVTHSAEIVYQGSESMVGRAMLGTEYDLNLGRIAVILFFAISGFVIPFTLERSHLYGIKEFVLSRVFRLYPAFWLSVFPSVATHFWMPHVRFPAHYVWWNFTMLPRLFGAEAANGGYWTLEVEILFYLCCTVLFIGRADKNAFTSALIAVLTFLGFMSAQPGALYNILYANMAPDLFFYLSYLSVMFWGSLVRTWWSGGSLDILSRLTVVGIGGYWCLYQPYVLATAYWTNDFKDIDQRLIAGYAVAMAIFLLGIGVCKITWAPLRFLGRISYSFYLFHAPVLIVVKAMILDIPVYFPGKLDLCEVLSFFATFALSTASFFCIEQPGVRLGRLVARRLRSPDRRVPASGVAVGRAAGIGATVLDP